MITLAPVPVPSPLSWRFSQYRCKLSVFPLLAVLNQTFATRSHYPWPMQFVWTPWSHKAVHIQNNENHCCYPPMVHLNPRFRSVADSDAKQLYTVEYCLCPASLSQPCLSAPPHLARSYCWNWRLCKINLFSEGNEEDLAHAGHLHFTGHKRRYGACWNVKGGTEINTEPVLLFW